MPTRNILILGEQGQLATALKNQGTIAGHRLISMGRPALDFMHPETIEKAIEDTQPALVINAAAYTAVDTAESERDVAYAINASGVGMLGRDCAERNIPIIHISTDYVFNGTNATPYKPGDTVAPQGVYGKSKAQGEAELRNANPQHLIFRTAWVYGEHGKNFLKTMVGLSDTRPEIRVVDDQHGTPTYANDLAAGIAEIAAQVVNSPQDIAWGTYHLTNSGKTTWCGFAREIFGFLANKGMASSEVTAITTDEYPTPAARPAYSILDCTDTKTTFGVELPSWQNATARCMENLTAPR